MRILDLFCCQGGAAVGYYRAGFDVVGVDINPQPRYPYEFHQADALEYLRDHGHEFDAIHASPPCQDHSSLRSVVKEAHGTAHFLDDTINLLRWRFNDKPWVVENVENAKMPFTIKLCGSEFGRRLESRDGVVRYLRRHRKFLSNIPLARHGECDHRGTALGVYGHGGGGARRGYQGYAEESREIMGIDWMDRAGLAQSIPPDYSHHIGNQLASFLLAPNKELAA